MNLDQRVELVGNPHVAGDTNPKGTIAGLGHIVRNGETIPVYIVKLDQGFYNSDHTIFVPSLVCHRDSLVPIT